ncbi:MAG: PAS domain-containing protein [Opitutaceae bacterium]|nr:PAS domain-containing protein [Verrucomicrobiales bacterium]
MLRELLDLLPDVIYVKDHESRFLVANATCARVMGAGSAAQLIGRTDAAFYPPDRAAVYRADELKVLEGIVIVDQEDMVVSPAGAHQYFLTTKIPLRDASGNIVGLVGSGRDITERKRSEAALKTAHQELVEASRQAGMAEVATGVLHNVGNVLNSVNVTSNCLADSLRKSKTASLAKVAAMLHEHEADLATFLTTDPKGKQIPAYLSQLAGHLAGEQAGALKELAELQKNIEHIKAIVTMQQGYAKVSGVTESVSITDLVEDCLRMETEFRSRRDVQFVREFAEVPPILMEKQKVLQILVNLVRNARHACDDSNHPDKTVTLRIFNGGGWVKVSVSDNGVGIPPENLTRIFAHGFTTKKDGHGFGLHSSALAAKQMGGSLTVHSDGSGLGATFTLELPVAPIQTPPPQMRQPGELTKTL